MPSRRNRSGKKCKRGGMNFLNFFSTQTPEEKIKKGLDDAYNGLDPVYTILEKKENAKFKKTKENIYVALKNIENALEEFKTENVIEENVIEGNVIEGEVSVNNAAVPSDDPPSSPSSPSSPSPPSPPPPSTPSVPAIGGKKKSMKGGKKLKKTKTKRRR